ncbi:MAG: hypothetical protein AB7G11_06080 [Phycisphaerales bacterium]
MRSEANHPDKNVESATVPVDPNPYNEREASEFWPLYARVAMPAIERACRAAARSLTDHAMSAEDMQAWVDDRMMRMLREGKWPVFHDHPSPADAAHRTAEKAKLLARWAYIALSRKTFREKARQAAHLRDMSRTERLASVSRTDASLEQLEEVNDSLDRLRKSISAKTRLQVAASWPEADERRRIMMELGVSGDDAEAMMQRVEDGQVKANTLDQMRSRSRREIRGILGGSMGLALVVITALMMVLAGSTPAMAGEQTGGRPGGKPQRDSAASCVADHGFRGEQTGGRPG